MDDEYIFWTYECLHVKEIHEPNIYEVSGISRWKCHCPDVRLRPEVMDEYTTEAL